MKIPQILTLILNYFVNHPVPENKKGRLPWKAAYTFCRLYYSAG